jgi:DNA-binding transcriptional regulator YiaG
MASCDAMHALRELRRTAGLSQQECADLMATPLKTFRMWDSELRPVPAPMLRRAREALEHRAHQNELLPLDRLASELGVHVRTLQAAARTGRLEVQFSTRSVFGRPMRLATRAAGERFKRTHYRRFAGQSICAAPLPSVPVDYDQQLKHLRRQLLLTQAGLAQRIGAARKAVVYQWESRKRTPSPVFWQRIQELRRNV